MKKENTLKNSLVLLYTTMVLCVFGLQFTTQASNVFQEPLQGIQTINEFKGHVYDSSSKDALAYVDINITGTNISTITNKEGAFLLKVPTEYLNKTIKISLLGYAEGEIEISSLKIDDNKIYLDLSITQLSNVNVYGIKNAEALVRAALNRKSEVYDNNRTKMTAFYRETIKKRNKNASLSEAVLAVYKQPYTNSKSDELSLLKSRKSTDYSRLDTLTLKLQGGPFSTLYTDIIKYPEYIFNKNDLSNYVFTFDESTQLNNRLVYVVNFKQKVNNDEPLYYGKLYIDSQTLALTSAIYNLNISNKELASKMFVRKKPFNARVYPTVAAYRVDYRTRNGKWYYGYGKIELTFKVNYKRKLFNNVYTLNCEMAITDWKIDDNSKLVGEKLKPNVVIIDKASGFSDPEFWGEYNIIEPEKSIENAIQKINKQLEDAES
ncbi:carboxypeptidase-like regulatory domain-containing protein [Gaetbulibacter aquiaggeris]|uniref:Carboxypeptidase-like regulatory domain-containing protein n=1 Tax=Gaetbulibacter aquiaggeris TaxID=1735373 RepID=A0ABW7MRA5_9FLAO